MIDQTIIESLSKSSNNKSFEALLNFMKKSGVPYKNRKLRGPLGIAAADCVYLDLEHLEYYQPSLLFFVILHETAHYKRIQKMGKATVIKMLSLKDFDAFCEHVIYEERVADRYGCLLYKIMTGDDFPKSVTQCLEDPETQRQYRKVAAQLFDKIDNSEEKYENLLKSFIIE